MGLKDSKVQATKGKKSKPGDKTGKGHVFFQTGSGKSSGGGLAGLTGRGKISRK